MSDLSHLHALSVRLSHEKQRLAGARTEKERAARLVWVAGIEREIANELQFLGIDEAPACDLTDDELLHALGVS